MSDSNDEILNELSALERRIDTLDQTFVKCTNDMLEALHIHADLIAQMAEAMALASSPSDTDLERSKTLREAFDRYDFVRKLALGQTTGDEND